MAEFGFGAVVTLVPVALNPKPLTLNHTAYTSLNLKS